MLRTERPTFVAWIVLAAQAYLLFSITALLSGILFAVYILLTGRPSAVAFTLIPNCVFPAVIFIFYLGNRLTYSRTRYVFFTDHIEFEEGFFTINKKTLRYRDVLEVTLRKGMLQRTCNLGTIYLGTLATGSGPRYSPLSSLSFSNISASGVNLRDIADPDTMYEWIRHIVEEAKSQVAAR